MTPAQFPQANVSFGPPEDMDESQVVTIPAFRGQYRAGNLDGAPCVIVAWLPSPEDIERIKAGAPIYLMQMFDGLPPHCLLTEFPEAHVTL